MADTFEVQLTLDLPGTLTPREVALLRWHLGDGTEARPEGPNAYEYPLWAERGPARHVGGLQVADLSPAAHGWSLTARQELHPDCFPDLRALLEWLGPRTTTVGPIGHVRFHEDHVPTVLIAQAGAVSCVFLKAEGVVGLEGPLFS
jgi:hypothetical protein